MEMDKFIVKNFVDHYIPDVYSKKIDYKKQKSKLVDALIDKVNEKKFHLTFVSGYVDILKMKDNTDCIPSDEVKGYHRALGEVTQIFNKIIDNERKKSNG